MTTRRRESALRPWIAALSLGATVGGWALLARQGAAEAVPAATAIPQTMVEPTTVARSVTVVLPPIPTVEALSIYAATAFDAAPQLDLPPIPVVVVPAPRPQAQAPAAHSSQPQAPGAPAAPAAQPQPAPPVTKTRSSG